ncbi:MAG: hypothetical protein JSR98_11965 [Proteobacteria bacterium]|nr:hypothetical protein [Pseudomonadota bacterium]
MLRPERAASPPFTKSLILPPALARDDCMGAAMSIGVSDDDVSGGNRSIAYRLNGDSLAYPQWLQLRNAQLAGETEDDAVEAGADGLDSGAVAPPGAAEGDDLPLSYDPDTGRFTVLSDSAGSGLESF